VVLKPRELDAQLVPRLAAGLRALLDSSSTRARSAYDGLQRRGTALLEGGAALRRLDERYASSGPLGLLREVPQLAVLLVALVFLAGTGAAVALQDPAERTGGTTAVDGGAGGGGLVLGPVVGADIDAHFAASVAVLRDVARRDPGSDRLALVSLREGLPPAGLVQLLERSGVELVRAYLRAPVPGLPEEIAFQTQGDVVADLSKVYALTAERKQDELAELQELAASIEPGTGQEDFKAAYEADAATRAAEAAAYAQGCACLFSLVVSADAETLLELVAEPLVRGVEVAPEGVEVTTLDLRPLVPTQTGTVVDPPPAVA
jgi:hypothetical protein